MTHVTIDSERYILDSSKEYSLYVLQHRAIGSFGDGLKDAMRKALYVMEDRASPIKTAALGGAMAEQKLYVHGDASGSICTIAAPFGNNIPLLTGLGMFGTRLEPTTYAASRYTEVVRPSYAKAIIYPDSDVAPHTPNYDGSTSSPLTYLPLIPLLLVNGGNGIAVGWATTILPRDPRDVVAAVISIIDGKKPKRLRPVTGWSDSVGEFVEYGSNGGAKWEFTGAVTVNDTSTMTVTDLPPFLSLEDFKVRLDAMEDTGKIQSYRDESTISPKIVISVKRGTLKGWTEGDAIAFLKLRQTKTENFVVVNWDGRGVTHYREVDGVDPVEQYLRDWVEWRFGWYAKRYERLIKLSEDELRFLRTIMSAHDDRFSEKVRGADDRAAAVTMVTEASLRWKPTKEEISAVVDLPTHRWTKDSIAKVRERISELEAKIKEDTKILKSDELRRGVFRADIAGSVSKAVSAAMDEVKKVREEAAEK